MKELLYAAGMAVFLASVVVAYADGAGDPAGIRMLHDYPLTMDKVKHFDAAITSFRAASKSDPSLMAEGEKMGTEPQGTLADVIAIFDRHPRVYAFYARQGLAKTDAAALPIALMDACMVVQHPQIASRMAGRVSPSQTEFCKVHLAELKTMKFFSRGH